MVIKKIWFYVLLLLLIPMNGDSLQAPRTLNRLSGLWHLNAGQGTTDLDYSGNGNALSLVGTPPWVTGNSVRFSYGLTLNGSNQCIQVLNESNFDYDRNMTFAGWVWASRTIPYGSNEFIGPCKLEALVGWCLETETKAGGVRLTLFMGDTLAQTRVFALDFDINSHLGNRPHFYGFVFDGVNNTKDDTILIVDGVKMSNLSDDGTTLTALVTLIENNAPVQYGARGATPNVFTAENYSGDMGLLKGGTTQELTSLLMKIYKAGVGKRTAEQ